MHTILDLKFPRGGQTQNVPQQHFSVHMHSAPLIPNESPQGKSASHHDGTAHELNMRPRADLNRDRWIQSPEC